MKVFVAFSLLLALAAAEHVVRSNEEIQQIQNECAAELEIPESVVEQYKQSEHPSDVTAHCLAKCILSKADLFDSNSGLNVENIHQQVAGSQPESEHDEELHAKIEACADRNEQGSDACEWAHRGAHCLKQNNVHLLPQSEAPTPAPAQAEAEAEAEA